MVSSRRADDHGARSDLAMLSGARLVSINELPGGMMLDETVTKQLVGREPISARFLHKEFFTFLPIMTPPQKAAMNATIIQNAKKPPQL